MTEQKFRVGGGYTAFIFNGQPLAYIDVLNDQGPSPVADPEPVQPIDAPHPIEIAFPKAHRAGQLQVSITETWNEEVWEQLPGFEGAADIIEVFERNINQGSIKCTRVVTRPDGSKRGTIYIGTVVTDIDDSEEIRVSTMTLPKRVTMMYKKKRKL